MDRFERLFEDHAEPLLGFLVYRTGNRPLAEDLVAETFERVIRARRRFDPRRGSEKTWLWTLQSAPITAPRWISTKVPIRVRSPIRQP